MKRLLSIGFLCLFFFITNARAALLSGEVSFNDATDLYTYTYTLDATNYDGEISIVDIWQNTNFNFDAPMPIAHTEPVGWQFVLSVGSTGTKPLGSPDRISGSFWAWWRNPGIENSDIQTFSFTTERTPSTSLEDNYALYNPLIGEYFEQGNVVGPQLVDLAPVSPVPENETYAMMLAGLGLIGFISRRSKKGQS
ncbi:MAG TPA: PEP-CTERM sorting domain-containing protein [Methylotenera sp.]|nr:PEP-CTERM sorting domain-containing protein [Methylotenera sp.]